MPLNTDLLFQVDELPKKILNAEETQQFVGEREALLALMETQEQHQF
jgi:hypothetical protein